MAKNKGKLEDFVLDRRTFFSLVALGGAYILNGCKSGSGSDPVPVPSPIPGNTSPNIITTQLANADEGFQIGRASCRERV